MGYHTLLDIANRSI